MTAIAILHRPEIQKLVAEVNLVAAMETGFVAYSRGRCVVPPVGELLLDETPGEVHIKCGYTRGEDLYVVKIASGFFNNPALGLPSGDGMMLLFRQATGELASILLDRGLLTDLRTAAAGAVAARHLAPGRVECIGILGTGVQARLQLEHLQGIVDCRRVLVAGRHTDKLDAYRADMESLGFEVETTLDAGEMANRCRLVVTTTASRRPLLAASDLRPGTHITAVGSDTPDKQELDAAILASADRIVADSLAQCRERGEISQALRAGAIEERGIVELGAVIAGDAPGRTSDNQITVADLTGVAVQDLEIATAVFDEHQRRARKGSQVRHGPEAR